MLEALQAKRAQLRSAETVNKNGDLPLHALIRSDAAEKDVVRFIEQHPNQLDRKNRDGRTALEMAAISGNTILFDSLISKGATFSRHSRPFEQAASSETLSLNMMNHILKIFEQEEAKKKKLKEYFLNIHRRQQTPATYLALLPQEMLNHLESFVTAAAAKGCVLPSDFDCVSACTSAMRPLCAKLGRGNSENNATNTAVYIIIEALLKHIVNKDDDDDDDPYNNNTHKTHSALNNYIRDAASMGDLKLLKLLFEVGGVKLQPPDAFHSLMHGAVYGGNEEVIRYLAAKGARMDRELDGRSLLAECQRWASLAAMGATGYSDGRTTSYNVTAEDYAALGPLVLSLGAPEDPSVRCTSRGELDMSEVVRMCGYRWGCNGRMW